MRRARDDVELSSSRLLPHACLDGNAMIQWDFTDGQRSISVSADLWWNAMDEAMKALGRDASSTSRLQISVRPDKSVEIRDADDVVWTLKPVLATPPVPATPPPGDLPSAEPTAAATAPDESALSSARTLLDEDPETEIIPAHEVARRTGIHGLSLITPPDDDPEPETEVITRESARRRAATVTVDINSFSARHGEHEAPRRLPGMGPGRPGFPRRGAPMGLGMISPPLPLMGQPVEPPPTEPPPAPPTSPPPVELPQELTPFDGEDEPTAEEDLLQEITGWTSGAPVSATSEAPDSLDAQQGVEEPPTSPVVDAPPFTEVVLDATLLSAPSAPSWPETEPAGQAPQDLEDSVSRPLDEETFLLPEVPCPEEVEDPFFGPVPEEPEEEPPSVDEAAELAAPQPPLEGMVEPAPFVEPAPELPPELPAPPELPTPPEATLSGPPLVPVTPPPPTDPAVDAREVAPAPRPLPPPPSFAPPRAPVPLPSPAPRVGPPPAFSRPIPYPLQEPSSSLAPPVPIPFPAPPPSFAPETPAPCPPPPPMGLAPPAPAPLPLPQIPLPRTLSAPAGMEEGPLRLVPMPTDFGDPDETVEMSGPVNLEAWAPPAAGAASEPLGDLASSSDALACEPPPMLGPAPQPPPDLDEWLFDQSMEIGLSPSIPEAGRRALQILLDLVKCDAGSVLFATYGMDALQFIAAAGPEAAKLREVTVPVDRSIAGFAFRSGFSFVVQDAMADDRHMKTVDGITGYKTRSLLVVPIRSTEGFNYGCIELLNSPWGFAPWMLLSAENIGTTLGGFIAERI